MSTYRVTIDLTIDDPKDNLDENEIEYRLKTLIDPNYDTYLWLSQKKAKLTGHEIYVVNEDYLGEPDSEENH
jgi:hypothetical protein